MKEGLTPDLYLVTFKNNNQVAKQLLIVSGPSAMELFVRELLYCYDEGHNWILRRAKEFLKSVLSVVYDMSDTNWKDVAGNYLLKYLRSLKEFDYSKILANDYATIGSGRPPEQRAKEALSNVVEALEDDLKGRRIDLNKFDRLEFLMLVPLQFGFSVPSLELAGYPYNVIDITNILPVSPRQRMMFVPLTDFVRKSVNRQIRSDIAVTYEALFWSVLAKESYVARAVLESVSLDIPVCDEPPDIYVGA